jgi:hypothetical protein
MTQLQRLYPDDRTALDQLSAFWSEYQSSRKS